MAAPGTSNAPAKKAEFCFLTRELGQKKKVVTLNNRVGKDYEAFLQHMSILLDDNVRNLHSSHGSRIKDMEDLRLRVDNNEGPPKMFYVALPLRPYKSFKKYGSLTEAQEKKTRPARDYNAAPVRHNRHINVSARCRKVPTQAKFLTVFPNGDKFHSGLRCALNHRMLNNWDYFMEELTSKLRLKCACTKLIECNEDGTVDKNSQVIQSTEGITTGATYVAIGRSDKLRTGIEYGKYNAPSSRNPSISPRGRPNQLAPLPRRRKTKQSQMGDTSTQGSGSTPTSSTSKQSDRTKPARKQKKEEDGPFHMKAKAHKRSGEKQRREVDYDKDEGGIYKSKQNNGETKDAQEVEETNDTKVDLPIDQVEAECVEEDLFNVNEDGDISIPSDNTLTKPPSSGKSLPVVEQNPSVFGEVNENSSNSTALGEEETPRQEQQIDEEIQEEETELKSAVDTGPRTKSITLHSQIGLKKLPSPY